MAEITALPKEISPDGKEIWDWALKLSAAVHRADEIRKLRQQIRNMESQCGSCSSWMTKACPKEKHSNKTGRSTGPSSQSIKCTQFAMTTYGAFELVKAKAKLADLESRDQS